MAQPITHYFDHDADIGIMGKGKSIEEAFIQAAYSTFAIMVDLNKIEPQHKVKINFEESQLEFALITWLNTLISQARIHGLIFSEFSLKKIGNHWQGEAFGSPWPKGIDRGTEVKGATLTGLSVKLIHDDWEAKCIVDV